MLTLSFLIMFFIFIYLVENDYENVGIDGWAEHCSIMHANTDIKFAEEYESICKAQGQDITWKDSLEPANLSKNRYNNIVACKWYLFQELQIVNLFSECVSSFVTFTACSRAFRGIGTYSLHTQHIPRAKACIAYFPGIVIPVDVVRTATNSSPLCFRILAILVNIYLSDLAYNCASIITWLIYLHVFLKYRAST